MLQSQRGQFDLPSDVSWLNSAYIGPPPRVATEAGARAARRQAAPWSIAASDFFTETDAARAAAAPFFNAQADDIAIVPAASYGAATAAANVDTPAGSEIVLLAEQFPSNVHVWRAKAAASGAKIVTVARPGDGDWTAAILDAIGPNTRLVATGHVHWIDGGLIDVAAVGRAAKAVGAAYVLDLTQSLGVLPFDAGAAHADFAVAASYKWLLGPYAVGFLYVAPARQDGVPLEHSWLSREDAQNFAGLTEYRDTFAPGARRFDMGERSNFATLPTAMASLAFLSDVTPEAASAHAARLNGRIVDALAPLGFEPPAHRSPHYLSLTTPPGVAPADIVARLASQKVFISQRGPRLRISPHLMTDDADVDRLIEALTTAYA